MSVVGEAGGIPEAEAQEQSLQPGLAVVDVMMPGVNGIDGTPFGINDMDCLPQRLRYRGKMTSYRTGPIWLFKWNRISCQWQPNREVLSFELDLLDEG